MLNVGIFFHLFHICLAQHVSFYPFGDDGVDPKAHDDNRPITLVCEGAANAGAPEIVAKHLGPGICNADAQPIGVGLVEYIGIVPHTPTVVVGEVAPPYRTHVEEKTSQGAYDFEGGGLECGGDGIGRLAFILCPICDAALVSWAICFAPGAGHD